MSDAQNARSSAQKMLDRRGWTSEDGKNFTNPENGMTLYKEPGSKFTKWVLSNSAGDEVFRNGELNLIIGYSMGHHDASQPKGKKAATKKVAAAPVEEPSVEVDDGVAESSPEPLPEEIVSTGLVPAPQKKAKTKAVTKAKASTPAPAAKAKATAKAVTKKKA